MYADINGADNIQQKAIIITLPLVQAGDSSNGGVALPRVYHFDRTRGFLPREVDLKLPTQFHRLVQSQTVLLIAVIKWLVKQEAHFSCDKVAVILVGGCHTYHLRRL
jgi:hypothetical protein